VLLFLGPSRLVSFSGACLLRLVCLLRALVSSARSGFVSSVLPGFPATRVSAWCPCSSLLRSGSPEKRHVREETEVGPHSPGVSHPPLLKYSGVEGTLFCRPGGPYYLSPLYGYGVRSPPPLCGGKPPFYGPLTSGLRGPCYVVTTLARRKNHGGP